jgi:hypothetical protein
MFDSKPEKVTAANVVVAESISQKESTEDEDSNNCAKSKQTEPMGSEWCTHAVKINSSG